MTSYFNIPGYPIAYWASKTMLDIFLNPKLSMFADATVGMISGDNDRFLRLWFEPKYDDCFFHASDYIQAIYTGKKWFPLQKGGARRFWYGNLEYVINYKNDGYELKNDNTLNGRVRSHNYNGNKAFQSGITWNSIGTSDLITRIAEQGFIFDAAGPLCSINKVDETKFYLGLLFSKVAQSLYQFINPTINYTPGTLLSLPVVPTSKDLKNNVSKIVACCIHIAKKDWDSFETSWEFKKHPLL